MRPSTPFLGESHPSRRFRKRWLLSALLAAWAGVATWNVFKPMPPGTDVSTAATQIAPENVQFLFDLTHTEARGNTVHEQQIFDAAFEIIDGAESFIVVDFFLVNELMAANGAVHRPLSRELADHLLARKKAKPALSVLLITDPINDVYDGAPSALLNELRTGGIDVAVTNLDHLRDSNAGYSALWRMFGQWWGNASAGGRLPNPFASDGSKITLRSYLALLNFKANHRKVVVADRIDGRLMALVTSANPHDASSGHSNVAIRFVGDLAKDMVASEMAIARDAGWKGNILVSSAAQQDTEGANSAALALVTEHAIREHLLAAINATRNGDGIRIATFYLSDRSVIEALLAAATRNVRVRLILDPNKDAFGRQKDGVPNRPVANELVTQSGGKIEVRWYRTHGEQFHTKLALITRSDRFIVSLGSANLTRRNIGNYNLEANIALESSLTAPIALEMSAYFDRLWNNEGATGVEFTAPFGAYQDADSGRYWRYRLMEATGLSTF